MNKKQPVPCGCGGKAITDYIIGEPCEGLGWFVYCKNCEIQLPAEYSTEDEAIDAWNEAMGGVVTYPSTTPNGVYTSGCTTTNTTDPNVDFHPVRDFMLNPERTAKVTKVEMRNPKNVVWKCSMCGQYTHQTSWSNPVNYCSSCGCRLEWE